MRAIRLAESGEATVVTYEVQTRGFPKYWLLLFGVLFCWAILPPILAYRALVYHPRRLMENVLGSI